MRRRPLVRIVEGGAQLALRAPQLVLALLRLHRCRCGIHALLRLGLAGRLAASGGVRVCVRACVRASYLGVFADAGEGGAQRGAMI